MAAPGIDVNLSKSVVAGLPSVPRDLTGSRRHSSSSQKTTTEFQHQKNEGPFRGQ
jgi:hypothetical protein